MHNTVARYRRLDSDKIIQSVRELESRIGRRFPDSGLSKIAAELSRVAEETAQRTTWIQRPQLLLRFAAALLSLLIVAIVIGLLMNIHQFRFDDFTNSIQAFESTIGSVVFISAAILFLMSCENRIKRSRALKAVHELRAMAHIVDMHQLTKDPELYSGKAHAVPAALKRPMTPFELGRYLDYCSDALALISKIAALYVQEFQDPVLLDAVDDVETLTSGLSRKIWQKITIFETLARKSGEVGEEMQGMTD
jgi:hypothetical protein